MPKDTAGTYLQPHYGNCKCLHFSWTTLRGIHCRHPIALMVVVNTFGQSHTIENYVNLHHVWLTRQIIGKKQLIATDKNFKT